MTADIIELATADGVRLELTPAGTIKASGDPAAVARWREQIREHKAGIVEALADAPRRTATPAERAVEKKPYWTIDEWAALSEKSRERIIREALEAKSGSGFNSQDQPAADSMGNIEWARWSWNPVTGCKHGCPYCYARDIADRFYAQKFEPSLWPGRLITPKYHKPDALKEGVAWRNVFSNSVSDLYGRWVPKQWIDAVLSVMRDAEQWNFLMLTKFPKKAAEFAYAANCWIGASVDMQARVKSTEEAFERIECGVRWLSLEPLIEPLTFSKPNLFNWVVIGGASKSTKTPEWTPPAGWLVRLAAQFTEYCIPVYLKTNGRPREYPGVITPRNADEAFHYLKRVEALPRNDDLPDDRRTCNECRNFGAADRTGLRVCRAIPRTHPVSDLPRRCEHFRVRQ